MKTLHAARAFIVAGTCFDHVLTPTLGVTKTTAD